MNISKKIIVCAVVCAALCVGATAYAAGSAADKVPIPSESSAGADIIKAGTSDMSADAGEAEEPAETAPSESLVSAEDLSRVPHVLPSKFAPEDMDLINTGYPNWDPATFIPAELNSEVYAAADGRVVAADYRLVWFGGYGSVVAIKHADDLYTVYTFLNPVCKGGKAFVKVGDTVKAGQCIGLAGFSGRAPENGVGYACFTELPKLFSRGYDPDYPSADTWADAHEEKYTSMVIPEEYGGYAGVITDADGNVVELVEANPAWQG